MASTKLFTLFAFIGTALVGALAWTQASSKPERFTVDGVFSINTPAEGYEWTEVLTSEMDGNQFLAYGCQKQESPFANVVALLVEQRSADDDLTRAAAIRGAYERLLANLKAAEFTSLKSTMPSLKKPVGDRVQFAVRGKRADGIPFHVISATVFGRRNVFHYQVYAGDEEQATALAANVNSLREFEER